MTHTREKGAIGEDIAAKFLEDKGFVVSVRNYRKKWGEIDIIAQKDRVVHFFEVKSVTYVDGHGEDVHRPEENVDAFKVKQIRRMIGTYFGEYGLSLDSEFYFHILCVYMNLGTRMARVKWIENIIL